MESPEISANASLENINMEVGLSHVQSEIQEKVDERNLMKFLDSMDDYLTQMDTLSSILRQGLLELASARHSMGTSRINPSLFDHKEHSAATTLQLDCQNVSSGVQQPHFELRKWKSSCIRNSEENFEDRLVQNLSTGLKIRSNSVTSDGKGSKEKKTEKNGSPSLADDPIQNERLKSLSMFGAFFSPRLRSAQISFETAIETLTEIANARASLLCAYEQACKDMKSSTSTSCKR